MVQKGDILVFSTDEKYKDGGDWDTIYVDYKKVVDTCSDKDLWIAYFDFSSTSENQSTCMDRFHSNGCHEKRQVIK